MKTIEIIGLEEKLPINCSVYVLGNPRMSDPITSDNVLALERLAVVSPNGKWLALERNAQFASNDMLTIVKAEEGAEEVVVPVDFDWEQLRIRDINNEGTLLFQAELERNSIGYGHSRRPLLFKQGDAKPLILPPPYNKEDRGNLRSPREDDRPASHTPYCYTSEDKIFGWSHRKYSERVQRERDGVDRFIYTQEKPGVWTIEYLPDFLNGKWLWPGYHNTFILSDRKPKDGIITFGLFDGKKCSNFDITALGDDPKVVRVASDNTFICHYGVKEKWKRKNQEVESSYYTLLAKPNESALQLFKDGEENPWLEYLSTNGKYAVGSHPDVGYFILKAHCDAYDYRVLAVMGWRIESLAAVLDDGKVYATATCIERSHGCFRLKLPVLLTPEW